MIEIATTGQKPELNFSNERALLIAAWAYGLHEDEIIHRYPLFAFVQSHIVNATEENLQGSIEKDFINWTPIGRGYYKLTHRGSEQICKFGKQNFILPKNIVYSFRREIEHFEISVTIDGKYIVKQNNVLTAAAIVVKNIVDITGDHIPTIKTSMPRKIFNWILAGSNYSWTIDTEIEGLPSKENFKKLKDSDDIEVFPEGKEKYRIHKSKERNQKLVVRKKQQASLQNQNLPCEICNFSFKVQYGEIGDKFIEAHHAFPIAELTEETETKLEDLILVCSNCHRMIHKRRPWLTIEEMRNLSKKHRVL